MEKEKIYSDGSIEEEVLTELKNGNEFVSGTLKDGAIFHNFTDSRENLLNWYPFRSQASVLEIGAGMGALTGLLCRKCMKVDAFEHSEIRSEIIKERHKKYHNLDVISGNIFEYSFGEKKYDYVILAGVLEYAAMNDKNGNPYLDLLKKSESLLGPRGIILVAIENRFGMKYWCGASEDHTGIPFDGIAGYEEGYTTRYSSGGVRTFDREELGQMMRMAGFTYQRWYYPLPDYKFPTAVFSDEKLPAISDIDGIKFGYSQESELIADERKLYKDIISNQVFPFFANSFLIEASKFELEDKHIIYASLKRDYRKDYRVMTCLDSDNLYQKTAIQENANEHLQQSQKYLNELRNSGLATVPIVEDHGKLKLKYYEGILAASAFREYLENGNFPQIIQMIICLKKDILRCSEVKYMRHNQNNIEKKLNIAPGEVAMGVILEYGYTDMVFVNSFWEKDHLVYFDQEWKYKDIPLNYILYRAIKYGYGDVNSSILQLDIFNYFSISKEQRAVYERFETELLKSMMDAEKCKIFDPKMYHDGLKAISRHRQMMKEMDLHNQKLQEKIESIEQEKQCILEEKRNILEEKKVLEKRLQDQTEELSLCIKQEEDKEIRIQKLLNEEKELNEKIIELKQEVLNKEGHIQLLLPPEREYKAIINSKMYKIMRFFCRIIDSCLIIPRFLIRNIAAFCRMMTHVNVKELKIAWGYVREEGVRGAYRHLMKDYHQGQLKKIQVDVQMPEKDEKKSIEEYLTLEIPFAENPLVSIVIPAYNQFYYTYHCIESIIKNSGNVSYEIILADDCSNDLTIQINQAVKNLIVAKTSENLLFLRNCNNAAKKANGEFILFLNNDTQVQENWLEPLVTLCQNDSSIGMVGSKLVYADGTLQEAGGIIWKDGSGWNYGRNMDAMLPEYNYVKEVDYISGAAIMIRTELWKQIGGFDDLYTPAYCEDSDLAFEVRKAGYKVVYQPLSVVVHFEGKSNGTDLQSGIKKYQVENNLKLQKKWKTEFENAYVNGTHVFRARERSKGKKVILVIDHYVPQFDKDAGSKTTFQYLKMFVKEGYSVKFLGDNFYQEEPYTRVLQQMGIEVLYGPWYAQHWKEWILDNKEEIDFAYLNRPHITIKYIDFLKENTRIKCIYYGHDLHFLRLKREYELTGDKTKLEESKEWMEKELYIMRKADISYYPSYIEEEEIHGIDPDIRVKAITAYVYEHFKEDISLDFSKKEGIVFVGGFGHPPNTDAVLWFAKEIYPDIWEKEKIPFYIVGSHPTPEVEKLNDIDGIIVKGFVSEEELENLYYNCRIVVVPLRYGAGVKGKVVEAIYYGTPMVTTSVGAEGIQGADKILEIVDDAKAFADSVLQLYHDEARLKETVQNYQSFIRDNFSVDAVWNIIKEDF